MTTLVAVGAQWGDEGKGKLVDWLAPKADLVVRFHGGNNAGHTLVVDGERTVLHVVPAGILDPGTINLIGPGVVVDPTVLLEELLALRERGVLRDPSRVRVSGRAHVILPWHKALDKAREEKAAKHAIGTTGRGIGPAYEDKVTRRGIRVADLLNHDVNVLLFQVRDGDIGPLPGKKVRGGAAHAAGSAGDQRGLAVDRAGQILIG